MLRVVVLCAALCALVLALAPLRDQPAIRRELVDEINAAGLPWKADASQPYWEGVTFAQAKRRMGTRLVGGPQLPVKSEAECFADAGIKSAEEIPTEFSAITNWPNCPTLLNIRDQSACGSCWAFGAAEAISDRYCTYNVSANLTISSGQLTSCCSSCGDGCDGGYPAAAWTYWVQQGIVDTGCYPYPFKECQHHGAGYGQPCPSTEYNTPPCHRTCNNSESFNTARHFGSKAYTITDGVAAIQAEIMAHGPVETAFNVYEDFLAYRSGVYVQHSKESVGGHAVKIVGWGVDANQGNLPYWIVANSWNAGWGQNWNGDTTGPAGFFWFLRGKDQGGIEDAVNGGIPKN